MTKYKIISAIILNVLSVAIHIVSFIIYPNVNINIYSIIAATSVLPFVCAAFLLSSLLPKKLRFIKYIIYGYAILLLICFLMIFFVSITKGFNA